MAKASSEVAQAIDAMSEAFVRHFNKGDIKEVVQGFYAEDASLLPPDHEMVSGRDRVHDGIDSL
jgi:ketosteroid isomerase-like protein